MSDSTTTKIHTIARHHAVQAMAAIADAQMKTWDKYPTHFGPTDIVTQAIKAAIAEVQNDQPIEGVINSG